jgi:hypothetical protein
MVGEQAVELAMPQDQEPSVVQAGRGGGSGDIGQECELAEEAAGPQVAEVLSIALYAHVTVDDDEELARIRALS